MLWTREFNAWKHRSICYLTQGANDTNSTEVPCDLVLQISVWIKPKLKRVSRRLRSTPKRWDINHSNSPLGWPAPIRKVFSSSELPDKLLIFHALINTWLWRYMIRISITRINADVLMYTCAQWRGRVKLCADSFGTVPHFKLAPYWPPLYIRLAWM